MGRHVLQGEFPWFFYGQTFMGAAEAYLHAVVFALVGSSVLALRAWPVLASLVYAALAGLLARRVSGSGRWAALFALVPSPFLLKWACDARLHYDLVLVLTLLLLLLALRALDPRATPIRRTRALFILALVAGLAWWINLLLGLLPATVGLVVLLRRPRLHRAAWAAPLALVLGSAPFWLFALGRGRLPASTATVVNPAVLLEHVAALVTNALPVVMGVAEAAPPGTARHVLSAGAVALLALAAGACLADRRASPDGRWLVGLLAGLNVLAVTATEHGRNLATEDPRYLLPLLAVVPVLLGGLVVRLDRAVPRGAAVLAALVLAIHAWGLRTEYPFFASPEGWRAWQLQVPGPEQRVAFLAARGLGALYTHDPDVLTFVSGERVAVSHVYLESYPPLARHVDGAARIGYFSTDPPAGFLESLAAGGIRARREASPLGLLLTDFALERPDGREIPPDGWTATASSHPEAAVHALDRDAATVWASDLPVRAGAWFQLDLGGVHRVGTVAWLPASFQEIPAGFRLEGSVDGRTWTVLREVVPYYGPLYWSGAHPTGQARAGRVEARFPGSPARYLRLTALGENRRFRWSMRELYVFEAEGSPRSAPPRDPAAAAEALRRGGIRGLYADPGDAATLAEAAPGAFTVPPTGLRVDANGAVPPQRLPRFHPRPGTAIAYQLGAPSGEAVTRMLEDAGLRFGVEEVGGYRILERFRPHPAPGPPLVPRAWTVSASPGTTDPRAVLDGRPDTRWTTGRPQAPGVWLRVDLGEPRPLAGLAIDLGPYRTDYPRGLAVEASEDGLRWQALPAEVAFQGPLSWAGTHLLRDGVDRVLVRFGPVRARAVRVTQTGRHPLFDWSVAELHLFGG